MIALCLILVTSHSPSTALHAAAQHGIFFGLLMVLRISVTKSKMIIEHLLTYQGLRYVGARWPLSGAVGVHKVHVQVAWFW